MNLRGIQSRLAALRRRVGLGSHADEWRERAALPAALKLVTAGIVPPDRELDDVASALRTAFLGAAELPDDPRHVSLEHLARAYTSGLELVDNPCTAWSGFGFPPPRRPDALPAAWIRIADLLDGLVPIEPQPRGDPSHVDWVGY